MLPSELIKAAGCGRARGVAGRRLVIPEFGVWHVDEDVAFRRLDELEDRLARRRLATPALADEAEDLPATDVERRAIDGPDPRGLAADELAEETVSQRKPDLQVSDSHEGLGRIGRPVTSVTSG